MNTQIGNERAIVLYERLGFRRRTDGLAVLELDIASHPAPAAPDPGPVP